MQRTPNTPELRRSGDLYVSQKHEGKTGRNSSSGASLFDKLRRSNRDVSSDPGQEPVISSPSPRDGLGNSSKKTTGVFGTRFKKGTKGADAEPDVNASPVVSRIARGVQASFSSIVIKKETAEASAEDTINPSGIRCFLAGARVQKNPLVRVLAYLYDMGGLLSDLWKDADLDECPLTELQIGMRRFERKLTEFEKMLPQFYHAIEQRQAPQADVSYHEIYPEFAKKLVDLKDGTESLDQILKYLMFMGGALIEVWNDPVKGLNEFERIKKEFETYDIYPRFVSALYKRKELCEIQTERSQIEQMLFAEIEEILTSRVLIDYKKPLKSEPNRRLLIALTPNAEKTFEEMDSIEKANRLANKPKEGKGDTEIDGKVKLKNDYDYLAAKYQFCKHLRELHRQAVQAIWLELDRLAKFQKNSPSLLKEDSTLHSIVKEILSIFLKNIDIPEATAGSVRTVVLTAWLERICDRIRYRYGDNIKAAMKKSDRSLLIENIKLRPCSVPSFDELLEHMQQELVSENLVSPGNVIHEWMKPESPGLVRCYVDDKEVPPETYTVTGGYEALLQTYSAFFGQPGMFSFFANLIGLPTKAGKKKFVDDDLREGDYSTYDVDFIEVYEKFVNLGETEKEMMKQRFEQKYSTVRFEDVYNYFKLFQKVLGREMTWYFTKALIDARTEKFNIDPMKAPGLLQAYERRKKNELIIRVNGPRCEIQVIRYDAVSYPEVILKQEFKIVLDFKDKSLILSKDKVSLSIEYPSHLKENADVQRFLFDLRFAAKAMGFPSLIIKSKPKGVSQQ